MSVFKAIAHGFSQYASFAGVSSRTQFWFWILFVCLILCVGLIIDGLYLGPMWSMWRGAEDVLPFDQDAGNPLTVILLSVLAMPTISIAGRRLHDSSFSAKWLLITFTGIGILFLVYLFVKKGTKAGQSNPYLN